MGVGFGSQPIRSNDLEALLGRVFVPVEPGEPFVTRLKARLVELRGARPTRGWAILAMVVGLVIATFVWVGAAVRIALAVLAVIGILSNRRKRKAG